MMHTEVCRGILPGILGVMLVFSATCSQTMRYQHTKNVSGMAKEMTSSSTLMLKLVRSTLMATRSRPLRTLSRATRKESVAFVTRKAPVVNVPACDVTEKWDGKI